MKLLLSLITVLNLFTTQCLANPFQTSELPKEMPNETEMSFSENGGMAPTYENFRISGNLLTIEIKTMKSPPNKSYAEISTQEKTELYQVFVENKFDLIRNDKREGIVYDAPSEGISIRADKKSFNISSGANSPLSGSNLKRYTNIKNAIIKLTTKYQGQAKQISNEYSAIKFVSEYHDWIFKNAKQMELNSEDFYKIDSLLNQSIAHYNLKQKEDRKITDLSKYKYQYVSVINQNSEREVWVNAFCSDTNKNWRKEIVLVKDGGNCFFNFKINLKLLKYYDFQVNGEA